MTNPDEIWRDDLLSRREEAEDLIGYLESVAGRPPVRSEGHAHVLAIDAGYGEGKTFFLKHFAQHMSLDHPVAFVDAWVDDLEDEPLIAIAATLEKALEPYIQTSEKVREAVGRFWSKAGRVTKIVSLGVLRRGAQLLITEAGAAALGGELTQGTEAVNELRSDALKDAIGSAGDEVEQELLADASSLMEQKVARFRAGQAAIRLMKEELGSVATAVKDAGAQLPIVIVVDELDRCRPTYALKALEEMKHLFDVSGVAFVLGLHSRQLQHSISSAYGSGFDSKAYLRRFISRKYRLKDASLAPLIRSLLISLAIPVERLSFPAVTSTASHSYRLEPEHVIANYMKAYGLRARDSFEVMERLQVCLALTAPHPVYLAYLLPLLIGQISGSETVLPSVVTMPSWSLLRGSAVDTIQQVAVNYHDAAAQSDSSLMHRINSGSASPEDRLVASVQFDKFEEGSYARPSRYLELLNTLARFS